MLIDESAIASHLARLKDARGRSENTIRAYKADLLDFQAFISEAKSSAKPGFTILAYVQHLSGGRSASPRTIR